MKTGHYATAKSTYDLERNFVLKLHYLNSYKLGSVLTLQPVELLVTFHQKAELCGPRNEQDQNCHNFRFLSKAAKTGAIKLSLDKIQLQTYIISQIEFPFYLIDIFSPLLLQYSPGLVLPHLSPYTWHLQKWQKL